MRARGTPPGTTRASSNWPSWGRLARANLLTPCCCRCWPLGQRVSDHDRPGIRAHRPCVCRCLFVSQHGRRRCARHRWVIPTAQRGSYIWKHENLETRMQKQRPFPMRPGAGRIQTPSVCQNIAKSVSPHRYSFSAVGLDEIIPCGGEISPRRYPFFGDWYERGNSSLCGSLCCSDHADNQPASL